MFVFILLNVASSKFKLLDSAVLEGERRQHEMGLEGQVIIFLKIQENSLFQENTACNKQWKVMWNGKKCVWSKAWNKAKRIKCRIYLFL